ncbi:hypothetical protein JFL43_12085 [Viridibacillus sp. YIM B01967]|uniref:Uncharacterized protein n=1 Tax=Viridibacillus soli TaxID=2798301 RepID=A0ABS1H839_9BACL|nr:hypothetical protein [Viridibacillus soli]MBK3495579.1 hypothetical protein [Viridibacillus soli]
MKLLKSFFLAILLLLGVTTPLTSKEISAKSSFTGEEIYKGIIFGQGEFGKKIITNEKEFNEMNSDESIKFANKYVDSIKSKDSSYFNNLKEVIESKNATASLELLQSSGKYFDSFTEQSKVTQSGGLTSGCLVLYCHVVLTNSNNKYVVIGNAKKGVQVGYAAWALKTAAVKNLSESNSKDPEVELANILAAI